MSGFLYIKMGTRFGLSFSFLFSMAGSIVLIFITKMDIATQVTLIPVFISMAKFGIAAAFNMCFIASVQLIPTLHTATAFGICNMAARSMTVLSPEVAEIGGIVPLLLNIGVAGIAAFSSIFIKTKMPKFV